MSDVRMNIEAYVDPEELWEEMDSSDKKDFLEEHITEMESEELKEIIVNNFEFGDLAEHFSDSDINEWLKDNVTCNKFIAPPEDAFDLHDLLVSGITHDVETACQSIGDSVSFLLDALPFVVSQFLNTDNEESIDIIVNHYKKNKNNEEQKEESSSEEKPENFLTESDKELKDIIGNFIGSINNYVQNKTQSNN